MIIMVNMSSPIVPNLSESLRKYSKKFEYRLLMLLTMEKRKLYVPTTMDFNSSNNFLIDFDIANPIDFTTLHSATILWEIEIYRGFAIFSTNKLP